MKHVKAILLPVDFSTVSASAFRYALRMAEYFDARIDLLYVVPPTTDNAIVGSPVNNFTEVLRDEATERMRDFFRAGMAAVTGLVDKIPHVRTFVRVGGFAYEVRRHIELETTDLTVLGTHGRQDPIDGLLGTHASTLLGATNGPLLILPENFGFRPFQRVCYATDLEHADAFQVGRLLRGLRPFRPDVDFVHVRTGEQDHANYDMGALRDLFHQPGNLTKTNYIVRDAPRVVPALFDYAREADCDLVVMHRPRRSWLETVFIKRTTRTAALHADRPLLIVHPADLADREEVADSALAVKN